MKIQNADEQTFICDQCGEECEDAVLQLEHHLLNHFCSRHCGYEWPRGPYQGRHCYNGPTTLQ